MLRRLPAALLLLVTAQLTAAENPAPPAATRGSLAARVSGDGRVSILDVASGESFVWSPPAPGLRALAFRPESRPGEAPEIVVAAPAASGSSTTIFALRARSGEIIAQATVPVDVALLCPAPGSSWVHVVGRRGDRWAIASLDLAARTIEGPLIVPGPIRGVALSSDGSRVFLAADDTVRAFATSPLRTSWLLRSPGRNRAVAAIPASAGMLVARDRQLAIFDPSQPPVRDPRTGAFPTDDAAMTLTLPFEPGSLSVQDGGRLVAALAEDGRALAVAAIPALRLVEIRAIEPAAIAAFGDGPPRLLLVSPDASSVVSLPIDLPEPNVTGQPVESPPAPAAPADPSHESPPAATPSRASGPAAPEAPSPSAADPRRGAASPPDAPPRVAAPDAGAAMAGRLSGRVTGDVALVAAVVLYGPNSILREFSRISPDPGGSFDAELPPPGRYRIVIQGKAGAQLSYSPPYYQVVIADAGISHLDFNVTGKIPGSIKN
ncbi:MAG: hypothetical protein HY049_17375 [Acidobacteria bacterium]|nr:hypothetical protein [Acidobacteriota bacterium]